MHQLDKEYGGCVYVTRKLRKHEKEAKERAEATAAAEAAAAGDTTKSGESGTLLLVEAWALSFNMQLPVHQYTSL